MMNPIFIARPVRTLEDLGRAIASAAFGPAGAAERPAAANLDALADLLRETRVKRVVVADCGLPEASLRSVLEVFADEGVELVI